MKLRAKNSPSHFKWSAANLAMLPVEERLANCPPFLQKVLTEAISSLEPIRIWIFGSRARGDHRELSDYDLAFEVPENRIENWFVFKLQKEELTETLLAQDWVLFSQASPSLTTEITEQGILVYEKKR